MPGPVFLEGENVTLRPPEEDDVDLIQRWMNDPSVWRPALDVNPTSRRQCAEFIEDVLQGDDGVHCLACDDSAPLGLVSLNDSQYGPDETSRARDTELAYWFDSDHHGQGYGSDAAGRMLQYAFEDRNFRRITARPGGFNDASIGLLESLGFTHEGTLREAAWFRGEYHDMLYYGLLREEWESK